MPQVLTSQMMLTTNPSSGLSQFLLHNADALNLRNGSSPDGRSVSPKSTDENVSGSSATTTSSPASTPSLLNNNNNNNFISQVKLEPGKDGASLGDLSGATEGQAPVENLFENVSLLAQSSLLNAPFGNVSDSQAFVDAALYAMATQPLTGAIRDPEMLQQLIKQQAMIQRQFGAAAGMTPLPMRQMNSSVQLGAAVASSSNNSNGQLPKQPEAVNPSIKQEQGPNNEKKRGYPYTFQYCVLCQKNVHSSKLPCHIRQCHVGKPMFQCPACDFTSTYSKNNVKSHMVSLHGITGDPISYMDDYAEQVEEFMKKCFPNVRGRARPFPSRTTNNYAQAANRQCPPVVNKNRQRTVGTPVVTTTPSPKAVEQRSSVPNGSPSSLLLPKFPMFPKCFPNSTSSESNTDKSESDNVKDEPMEVNEPPQKEPQSPAKPKAEAQPTENVTSSLDFIDHDSALFTPYPLRFVSDARLKGTVFETFSNSSELIDRIDLTEVAAVFESDNNSLLTPDQIKKVAEIRRMLPAKNFETMFALYKCDTSLLSLAQIELIKSVSPSEVDAKRFKTFCETNSVASLTDEEKFVIELSNIEQLYTRLRVMEMSHSHPEQLFNLHQEINVLRQVASTIHIDGLIASILQCSTIYANFLCGDFGAQLIHGLRVSQAIEVCKHQLSTGESIGARVADMLPVNCLGDSVAKRLSLYREACKYKFSTLDTRVNELSNGLLQLEAERQALGIETNSIIAGVAAEEGRLRYALKTAQAQMNETLRYFAERPHTSHAGIKPEEFIENIVELLRILVDNA